MSNNIILKKSSVGDKVPLSGDLQYGELALNYADGNLFYKNSSNAITTIASNKFVSVTGNVTGGNITTAGILNVAGNATIGSSSTTTITDFTFGYFQDFSPTWAIIFNTTNATLIAVEIGDVVTINFDTGSPITVTVTGKYYNDGNNEASWVWTGTAPPEGAVATSFAIASVVNSNLLVTGIANIGQLNITTGPSNFVGNISATGNVTGNYFIGNGSQLTGITASGGVTTFSSSPPASPSQGDTWIDSDTGIQYIYFNDGSSSQWAEMEAMVSISSGTAPASSQPDNVFILTGTTTGNVETEIFVDGVANSRVTVPVNTSSYYTVDITCRRTNGTDFAAFTLKALASNAGNTVTDIGSVYEIVVAKTDSLLAVDARADDTNNSIGVYVTGVTGKTFNWKAVVTTVEV